MTHTHFQLPQTFLQGGCQVHAGEQLAVLPPCHASGLCFDANLQYLCAHACAACSLLQLLQRQHCLSKPLPELPKCQSTDSGLLVRYPKKYATVKKRTQHAARSTQDMF